MSVSDDKAREDIDKLRFLFDLLVKRVEVVEELYVVQKGLLNVLNRDLTYLEDIVMEQPHSIAEDCEDE